MICLDSFKGRKSGDAAAAGWRIAAGRREATDRAGELLAGPVPRAVFVMAGPGIGKSMFLEAVTKRLEPDSIVERIHCSPSLERVPFGVLAPYTSELDGEDAASSIAVLRAVWAHFEQVKGGREVPLVLAVDDAHYLDDCSAAILVDMVSAGWSSVLVAACPRPGLPQPLNQLWYDGLAERIELRPLDGQQLTEALAATLKTTVPASCAEAFWRATAGNPLLVGCLLKDAQSAGILVKRGEQWHLKGALPADGPELTSLVARDVARRSAGEQETLKLIALAGSVNRRSIEELCGAEVVRGLIDQHLVSDIGGYPAELQVRHSIVAEAIRKQVTVSRSLQLRLKLEGAPGTSAGSDVATLRNVEWALECGQPVTEPELLRAAIIALKSNKSPLAVRLAGRITTGPSAPMARAVSARARFSMGDYTAARSLLEPAPKGLGPDETLAITMLRTASRMAGGLAPDEAAADEPPRHDPASSLLKLALAAEQLADCGRLQEALEHVAKAAAGAPRVDNTLYFFEELVVFRAVCVYLGMGEWAAAHRELDGYEDRHGSWQELFEGTMQALRGYSCIRQGKVEQGSRALLPATESLRRVDPLQLYRFSASLAFYAAARMGNKAQARRLAGDIPAISHVDRPGMGLRAAAYLNAGNEYLYQDGKGLGALRVLCDSPEVTLRPAVLLECLLLCAELGDKSVMQQITRVAEGMDGRWAAAVAVLAGQWGGDDANALLKAAGRLAGEGFVNLAREVYLRAGTLLQGAGDARRYRQSVSLREKCDDLLGLKHNDGYVAPASGLRLTKRERDIADLAARGFSDKDIAQRLMVSVRTVEGHLYRAYVKLGVRSRDELSPVLPQPGR